MDIQWGKTMMRSGWVLPLKPHLRLHLLKTTLAYHTMPCFEDWYGINLRHPAAERSKNLRK